MRTKTMFLSLAIACLILTPTALAQSESESEDPNVIVVNETQLDISINETLGRIDLKVGSSNMHLNYGTDESPGGIGMMTVQKSYMGVADIHRGRGPAEERVGIPAFGLFYQKLDGILEYRDSNGDGLFNVRSNGLSGSFEELADSETDTVHEEMLKGVKFSDISWDFSMISQECQENNCVVKFSLSAYNLPYAVVETTDVLEELTFIFTLTTEEVEVQHEQIPHYQVNYHRQGGMDIIDSSSEGEPLNVNTTAIRANWKYDEIIKGWDIAVDENGNETNDTRLMQFIDLGYASYMDQTVSQWAHQQFGQKPAPRAMAGEYKPMNGQTHDNFGHPLKCGLDYVQSDNPNNSGENNGGNGTTGEGHGNQHDERDQQLELYKNANCVQEGDEINTGIVDNASAIRSGSMHFNDEGRKFGSMRWVSNATVDGNETEVLFQIHGHRPVLPLDVINLPNGNYRGVRISGGYNLVIGEDVLHDPEYEADLMDIETLSYNFEAAGFSIRNLPLGIMGVVAFIGVGALLGVVMYTRNSSKRKVEAPLPEAAQWGSSQDWVKNEDWSKIQN